MRLMTQTEMAEAWKVPQSDISIAARNVKPAGKTSGTEHKNKRAANLYDPEPVSEGLIELYTERRDNLRQRADEWERKKVILRANIRATIAGGAGGGLGHEQKGHGV